MIEVILASCILASAGLWLFQAQLTTFNAVKQGYQQSVVEVQRFNATQA